MHRKVDVESGAAPLPEDGETRQRVRVELTPERLSWAADLVADARAVADRTRPPLPLVDSPQVPVLFPGRVVFT